MTTETETFAVAVTHNGQDYYSTGKTGTNIRSGKRVAEMEAGDCSRVWVALDGQVFPE